MNSYWSANFLLALFWVVCSSYVNTETHTKAKLVPYSIPQFRELKKALGFNEDTYLNFTELASKYHYPSEEHTVTTEDGYVLTLFRILSKCSEVKPYPVLLMHGIIDSSDLWILSGPETGLGYILANNCYDVWAANSRGNRYSRRHVRLDPDVNKKYWNFTFDDFGNYDLPALVDYIQHVSRRPKLYYIGHSQGTTSFFVMGSLRPEYNDKIRLSIQLAPVAWLKNIASPIAKIIAQATETIKALIEETGYNELFAHDQLLHLMTEFVCQYQPDALCSELIYFASGYKAGTINSTILSIGSGHFLVGTALKNFAHFGQLVTSKQFQRYDEGRAGNIKRYGRKKPPKYVVSKITSPVVLINGHNDWLSTEKDINILQSRLSNVVESYFVPETYWSHNNHLWGLKAPTHVFPKILHYLNRYDTDI